MKAPTMPKQRAQEVWAGSRMSLNVTTADGSSIEADIWIEVSTGEMRLLEVQPAGSSLEAFAGSLWNAMVEPVEGDPYRPGTVVVDRQDLAKALSTMARLQKLKVEVDPSLTEQFEQLREDLEHQFEGGSEFLYLGHDDVEPDLVDRFFKATSEFFLHQWSLMQPWIWLEVEGIHSTPVFVSMLGEEDTAGILLCWDLETAEKISRGEQEPAFDCLALNLSPPDRLGEETIEEIEANDWPVTTLGVPLLARPNRLERMSPLASEIQLMLDLFEVLPAYFQAQGTEVTSATSLGQTATVRLAVGDFEPAEDPTPEEVLADLEELEARQQWSTACALALAFQEEHDLYDELLMMKATSYMHRMGSAGTLDEFVQALGNNASSVWEYVKAWAALARDHKPTFRKRLKKAVKGRPDIANALLHQTESGSEPFLICWSEIWREHPGALEELRALQKA